MISTFGVAFYGVFSHLDIKNFAEVIRNTEISVILSSVIIAIIVCKLLIFSILKLQQFSLIIKFSDTYISSNSRYIEVRIPSFIMPLVKKI